MQLYALKCIKYVYLFSNNAKKKVLIFIQNKLYLEMYLLKLLQCKIHKDKKHK